MDAKKLQEIIDSHGRWLSGEKDGERAYLSDADLSCANLRRANLRYANLSGANLPPPTMLLLANWGTLSDRATLALMRLDCAAHPVGKLAFDQWKDGGMCPYTGCRFERAAQFTERRCLWSYGRPPSIWTCCKMVLDEKCPGWDKEEGE